MKNRRQFIKKLLTTIGALSLSNTSFASYQPIKKPFNRSQATVFRALGNGPVENIKMVLSLMGGVETLFGKHDIVLIKPNIQWWNQGSPNIASTLTLIEMIINRPGGFDGEVVITENTHRGNKPWESTGWATPFEWNSDSKLINNFNDLSSHSKKKYGDTFSVSHLINVASGNKRVYSPQDGPGYVYCDGTGGVPLIEFNNGCHGERSRSVIMTYPILRTDRGTIVDFKHGVWEKDAYIDDKPVKFINLSALNHHSYYCGITSSIKNYLGISDLSGGPDPHNNGMLTKKHYNFHSFPFDKWSPGPVPGMIGAEIGVFLDTIRKADLNITTANWVGMASRIKPPIVHTNTVLASQDPVALDFHASKYLVYPNTKVKFHDPENATSPVHQYLKGCAKHSGYIFNEEYVDIKSYDHALKRLQRDDELLVKGEIKWGSDWKILLHYMAYRTGLYKLIV